MKENKYIIAITFIWIGFVCAISFMEAWVKFQAPGITTELGLSIGQLVFRTLNWVEVVCALLIIVLNLSLKENRKAIINKSIFVPIVILFFQTIWLLPALNERSNLIIAGDNVPDSRLHLYYVLLELIKVIFLFLYGFKTLKKE